MRVTIIGATGGIGRLLVEQALAAGHEVTAVARTPRDLPATVKTVQVDLMNASIETLVEAVRGADVVLSGLGMRSKADAGIATKGTRSIVEAMKRAGTKRLIVVSAGPVASFPSEKRPNPERDPGDSLLTRFLMWAVVKRVFAASYRDLVVMEEELMGSELEWTIVRPPRLLDRPRGAYRLEIGKNVWGGNSVGRADVAHAMIELIGRPESIRKAVGVAT